MHHLMQKAPNELMANGFKAMGNDRKKRTQYESACGLALCISATETDGTSKHDPTPVLIEF